MWNINIAWFNDNHTPLNSTSFYGLIRVIQGENKYHLMGKEWIENSSLTITLHHPVSSSNANKQVDIMSWVT